MKINRPATTTYTVAQTHQFLGMSRTWFYDSGIAEFLDYYQDGRGYRAYLISDVTNFNYWLTVRKGMIALGHWAEKCPTLPTGDTMEAKRAGFEAWLAVRR